MIRLIRMVEDYLNYPESLGMLGLVRGTRENDCLKIENLKNNLLVSFARWRQMRLTSYLLKPTTDEFNFIPMQDNEDMVI